MKFIIMGTFFSAFALIKGAFVLSTSSLPVDRTTATGWFVWGAGVLLVLLIGHLLRRWLPQQAVLSGARRQQIRDGAVFLGVVAVAVAWTAQNTPWVWGMVGLISAVTLTLLLALALLPEAPRTAKS